MTEPVPNSEVNPEFLLIANALESVSASLISVSKETKTVRDELVKTYDLNVRNTKIGVIFLISIFMLTGALIWSIVSSNQRYQNSQEQREQLNDGISCVIQLENSRGTGVRPEICNQFLNNKF